MPLTVNSLGTVSFLLSLRIFNIFLRIKMDENRRIVDPPKNTPPAIGFEEFEGTSKIDVFLSSNLLSAATVS